MRKPRVFLTARWIHLAMLNFELEPRCVGAPGGLGGLVPRGTELDTWQGRSYASLVGFQFLDARVLGVSVPFHRDFDEVNLRFYVRRETRGELRRGVVFVKELVPRRAIAWVANALFGEKYAALPMSHDDRLAAPERRLVYSWRRDGALERLAVTATGAAEVPAADSEAAFIAEHYWGYSAQRDGSTLEYEVEHPPWRVWRGADPEFACDVARLYGERFAPALAAAPVSCFIAEGSTVLVRRGMRVE